MTRSSRSNYKTSKLTPTKMDIKRTTTETIPSNNHTSPNQLSNSSEKKPFRQTTERYRLPCKESSVFGGQNL